LITKDKLNMFRANFAHLQDRTTEIFTAYGIMQKLIYTHIYK